MTVLFFFNFYFYFYQEHVLMTVLKQNCSHLHLATTGQAALGPIWTMASCLLALEERAQERKTGKSFIKINWSNEASQHTTNRMDFFPCVDSTFPSAEPQMGLEIGTQGVCVPTPTDLHTFSHQSRGNRPFILLLDSQQSLLDTW